MPSFFDLQRYAKTGIASADMTAYDKMRALAAFGGGTVQTLTGIPPLSFKADGKPLISWSMKGNGQQTGTPTPDNIIMPTFCGVRTANLFDPSTAALGKYINAQGVETNSTAPAPIQALNHTDYIDIQPNTNYTFHYKYIEGVANTIALCWFDTSKSLISRDTKNVYYQNIDYTLTATSPENAAFCVINFTGYLPNESMELSFNSGTTALPYEPYGYKIPISNASVTTPLYLGEVSTVRIIKKLVLDGTEPWSRSSSNGTFYLQTVNDYLMVSGVTCACTHYQAQSNATGVNGVINGKMCVNPEAVRLYIRDTNFENVSAFKAYLAAQYAAGTPVTVWYVLETPETGITNEPLAKIGDYADELHSEDAAVTIPTVKGSNTLTVETELQPSEMTIKYRE